MLNSRYLIRKNLIFPTQPKRHGTLAGFMLGRLSKSGGGGGGCGCSNNVDFEEELNKQKFNICIEFLDIFELLESNPFEFQKKRSLYAQFAVSELNKKLLEGIETQNKWFITEKTLNKLKSEEIHIKKQILRYKKYIQSDDLSEY